MRQVVRDIESLCYTPHRPPIGSVMSNRRTKQQTDKSWMQRTAPQCVAASERHPDGFDAAALVSRCK